ncbi:unnamed protein product, partial [Dovyalis caffra]
EEIFEQIYDYKRLMLAKKRAHGGSKRGGNLANTYQKLISKKVYYSIADREVGIFGDFESWRFSKYKVGARIDLKNLVIILEGCKNLDYLDTRGSLGFDSNEKVLELTSHIETFKCEGSMLEDKLQFTTFLKELHENFDGDLVKKYSESLHE